MSLPVRELLANFLQKRHDTVMKRMLALAADQPDLDELRQAVQQGDYQHSIGTLLQLLAHNIADPNDNRCFDYAEKRAQERFRQRVPAYQMVRLVALHRRIVHKMIQRHFADEPGMVRQMHEIIDGQFSQLQLTFSSTYENLRDQQWRASETKYHALFENASEAILSFRPGEGRIIEMNAQTLRLLGRDRPELLDTPFADLFTPEHRDQAQWLIDHQAGTANIRVEDMVVRRADGLAIPVSLSCNWTQVSGDGVAQVIMRDITQLRQMQRELRDYADQLEARVTERTNELQASEERYRELFLQEQRRAQHLSLVNAVGRCGLENISGSARSATSGHDGGADQFLHQAILAVQSHFPDCDATFYLCHSAYESLLGNRIRHGDESELEDAVPLAFPDAHCDDLVVIAQAGGRGLTPPPGSKLPLDAGLPGLAARHGEMLLIEANAAQDERYRRSPGVHRDSEAQICVPVFIETVMTGVMELCSDTSGAFDSHDAGALQTVAGIIAGHLQSSRVFREMRELSEFHQTLTNTMLHSLLITSRDGLIRVVNRRLCQTLRTSREAIINKPLEHVLGAAAVQKHDLYEVQRQVRSLGVPWELQDVHVRVSPGDGPDYTVIFDLRFFRIFFRGEAQVVLLMINVTQRWRRENQMQMMNEMGRLFQSSLDVDTVLHTVLTCITAGPALGFNRAFVFLRDDNTDWFRGATALGPSSVEEANRIWWELSQSEMSLQDILDASPKSATLTPLQQRVSAITFALDNPVLPALARAVFETRAVRVTPEEMFIDAEQIFSAELAPDKAQRTEEYRREYLMVRELFTARQTAIAPLVAKDRVIGVVIADNLYSDTPVEAGDLQLLDTLARQAGLALDNARAYEQLQKAQKDLLAADRLVVIGELAARVSHEIRNPLATIGGWARNLTRKADNPAEVQRKAGIITDEVKRLEELLTDVLGMSRARPLNLEPNQINEIIERALMLAEADIKANNVRVDRQLDGDLPITLVDRNRLLQALLNIIRNGAQAMSGKGEGVLRIATRLTRPSEDVLLAHPDTPAMVDIEIRDEGKGISQQALKQIFDPFFSTKLSGSGLGLSVTRRIVQDHGGEIEVNSEPDHGTAFVLRLPFRPVSVSVPDSTQREHSQPV